MKGKEGSYVVRAGLRVRHALVVITVVALFTGCNSSEPQAHVAPVVPGIKLPVFEKSCALQPGPPSVVPIRIVRRWGPDDERLSRPVLREPGGEIPPGHSPGFSLQNLMFCRHA